MRGDTSDKTNASGRKAVHYTVTSGSVPTATARTVAWGGAALFAISLIYFLFTYFVTFGETPEQSLTRAGAAQTFTARENVAAILWDVALFTIFALHHSLFARERLRAEIRRLAGPLERSLYVWIASALFIVVCATWAPVDGILWRIDAGGAWILWAIQLLGVWLTLRGAAVLDVFDLAGVRQLQQAQPSNVPIEFKTTGPYGRIRHPIYAGWFVVMFAVPTMTMTRLVFAITSCAYLLIAIPLEERSLRRTTGGSYEVYMKKVRWRLAPGLFLLVLDILRQTLELLEKHQRAV
jgi:methanethiol S-methyltransferase